MKTNKTIIALVEDKPGVLNRIASKFRQRGFNIESLAVGHTEVSGLSRMTIVVREDTDVDQVVKQLDKLIDVIKIEDISGEEMVSRELALIKVAATHATRSEILQMVDVFRANVIDMAPTSLIVEVTGDEDKINAMVEVLQTFGIVEMHRTGVVSMVRGAAGKPLVLEESKETGVK